MEGDRIAPTAAVYVSLIAACGRCGDYGSATAYFHEMADRHGFPRGNDALAAYLSSLATATTVGTTAS